MKPATLLNKLRVLSAQLNKRGVYLTFSRSAKASIAAAQKLQQDGRAWLALRGARLRDDATAV